MNLGQQINETWPMKKAKGDVGIELELEGDPLKFEPDIKSFWETDVEPSLRKGGFELVLKKPIPIDLLDDALEDFQKCTAGSVFVPSLRTSTHVHVNVQELTLEQLFSVIIAWWYVEDLLVKMHGTQREGNLHCLRLTDAEGIYHTLAYSLSTAENLIDILGPFGSLEKMRAEKYRYAALNLASVPNFGSVEFRFLKFPETLNETRDWTRLLHDFVQRASKLDPMSVVGLSNLSTSEILFRLVGPQWAERIEALGTSTVERCVRRHVFLQHALAQRVAEAGARGKSFGPEDAEGNIDGDPDAGWAGGGIQYEDDEPFYEED